MPFLFLSGRREKAVRPVHFPFVEQPDLDGVFGAVEGAAHAHQAVAAKDELGAYDYQLTKSEMKEAGKIDEVVQKIKRACELRRDNKMLAEMDQRQKEKEELIRELKRFTIADREG